MIHHPFIEVLAFFTITLAAFYAFTNGFKDASGIVATVVSTNALSPRVALVLVAVFQFVGASLLGTAVARTVGGKIINFTVASAGSTGLIVVAGALLGALVWNGLSWYKALPTSSGQALLGGLLGASVSGWGINSVVWRTAGWVFLSLVGTPLLSFCVAASATRLLSFISEDLSPRWNEVFRWLQIPSCMAVSLAYSTNDAQGVMGVVTLGLVVSGLYGNPRDPFQVPRWVIQLCAFAIASGVLVGGSRILKTLGMRLYRIRPLQGLGAQVSSAATIFMAAFAGFPASTTQVITGSILGAGVSLRPKAIRWAVVQQVVLAWLVTIPSTAVLGAIGFWILRLTLRTFMG